MSADGDLSRETLNVTRALLAQAEKMSDEDIFVDADAMIAFFQDAIKVLKWAESERTHWLYG